MVPVSTAVPPALRTDEAADDGTGTPASLKADARASAPVRHRGQQVARYVLVSLIVVVGVDALVGERGLVDRLKADREAQALEVQVLQARVENARLREEARRLREDPVALEELARREFGFLKPGEQLFIVKDVPPTGASRRAR